LPTTSFEPSSTGWKVLAYKPQVQQTVISKYVITKHL
jgi:hypothetical protein